VGSPTTLLKDLVLALPRAEEQGAIARFLDERTARIDALVAKKERLIELLQEKRTGLIMRAVTKGLDPNVPMKDSRVEWLGKVPAHTEGGDLLIGVGDDGSIVGIEADKLESDDKFMRHLSQVVRNGLGDRAARVSTRRRKSCRTRRSASSVVSAAPSPCI
jgi:hypothetical protein